MSKAGDLSADKVKVDESFEGGVVGGGQSRQSQRHSNIMNSDMNSTENPNRMDTKVIETERASE